MNLRIAEDDEVDIWVACVHDVESCLAVESLEIVDTVNCTLFTLGACRIEWRSVEEGEAFQHVILMLEVSWGPGHDGLAGERIDVS